MFRSSINGQAISERRAERLNRVDGRLDGGVFQTHYCFLMLFLNGKKEGEDKTLRLIIFLITGILKGNYKVGKSKESEKQLKGRHY